MSAYAWSGELEEAEDYPATTVWERIGPRKVTGLAIVGACVAVVAVGVAGWFVLHQPQRMSLTVIRPSVVVTTSVVTVAAPAPPTVTQVWTATATAEAVPPSVAPNIPPSPDTAYINMLKNNGWTITNADDAIYKGHLICTAFQQGYNQEWIEQHLNAAPEATPAQSLALITAAQNSYPNCR